MIRVNTIYTKLNQNCQKDIGIVYAIGKVVEKKEMNLTNQVDNIIGKDKMALLSPEVKEMFLKYSGPLIQLGIDLVKRDYELVNKRKSKPSGS